MPLHRRLSFGLVLLTTGLGLAACGNDDESSSTPTTTRAQAPVNPADRSADLGGVTPFSSSSPWNRPVDNVAIDPSSDRMMRLASTSPLATIDGTPFSRGDRTSRNLYINLSGWAPAVYAVGAGTNYRMICRQRNCWRPGDAVPSVLKLPASLAVDPGHDGWLVIVDQQNRVVWDLWRARRAGNVISFAFARKWALDQAGIGPLTTKRLDRAPSMRGSGLPMLGGLIRPAELRAGRIPHALAIAVPGPAAGKFVRPASTTNGLSSVNSVPQGARLRLRPEALTRIQREKKQTLAAVSIAQALYTYGAIVVDRANSPTLYAQSNGDYKGLLAPNALRNLTLKDFQVLTLPRKLTDPDAPPEATDREDTTSDTSVKTTR